VTRIAQQHIDDSLYQKALETFTGKELVDFTLAIVAINGWNRLNISFRIPPGYQF
jgi:alkylhydroperoxidase family enzyme